MRSVAVHGFPVAGRGAATRSRWLRSGVVMLLAGVAAAVGCVAVLQALPGETPRPTATARHGLTSLPLAAQGPVSASLGQDAPAYRVRGLQAVNPAQHLRTSYSRRGVTVAAGAAQLGMALSAYGHGRALRPVEPALPRASDNRVRYAHGALTEWYANGPLGIEQGFDVAARPAPAAGPLTLSLALSGGLAARLRGDSVLFTGGGAALRYGGLVATDADGHVLRSWLQLVKGHLLIRVADRGASYPLRIDPMVQQGKKLTGTGAIGTGRFGYIVALSGDGNTALIGGNYLNIGAGAAWVFTRSGATWSQQGGKLVGTGHVGEGEFAHVGEGEFGASVALSDDGDTALIGGPADNEDLGAAWVFTRSGSTWTQQGAKLTGAGESGKGRFGTSVALSADGDTALIGGTRDNGLIGAAWVFTRSGGIWTQQGEKLTGTGEAGQGEFGRSVALSADGGTALVGGRGDNGNEGAAWAFTRSGSTWTQQGEKLTANDEDGEGMFGTNVTLSADGDTALIGGWNDDSEFGGNRDYSGKGAAWIFTRSGSTWTQQGPKLIPDDEAGNGKFGTIVSLSANGDTALIGGWNDEHSKGAAWVFTRSGSIWTQQGPKLTGGGETGEGRFGVAVALSADGDTALVGGLADNSTRGAAWLFSRSGSTWTQQGSKLTPDDGAGEGEFGTNVALSADGATALIGAWRDNSGTGAAWAFVNPPEATTAAATNIGETSATLNGTLAGGGSKAYFQYGTTAAYGNSTAIQSVSASGSQSPLAAALDGLAPGTTYHFRLVAENSGGVTYGDDQTFTTEARATTAPTEPTTPPPSPPNETLPAPVVQHARQSATRWRAGNRLASISRAKAPIGTIFSFTLNEQATVTFSFAQRVSGRKVSGKCVAQTEKNRRKPACSRAVPAGTLTFTAHTGANKVAFQGRISPAKKLKPGHYTVVITATNSAGMRSAPKSLNFTILR
jgi:FG-GAP repeat protein